MDYASFAELADACHAWCQRVNARPHRETKQAPVDRLAIERRHLHPVPAEPHAMALGEQRLVDEKDQTIRFGSVRYSTPPGYQGATVWCRVVGEELVIVGRSSAGLVEIARHELSTPGNPRIADEHYPHHPGGNLPRPPRPRARTAEEVAFLGLGDGAHRWLVEAAAAGKGLGVRIPSGAQSHTAPDLRICGSVAKLFPSLLDLMMLACRSSVPCWLE